MLKFLAISNFKLIDKLSCEFSPGLTVLTGETGAGKSIILNALNILLGEKPGTDIFHDDTRPVTISAVFSLPQNPEFLKKLHESGFSHDEKEIIFRRQLSLKSHGGLNNRIYVNDQPATGATVTTISDYLLEFVDQYQQQSLRDPKALLKLLDTYGNLLPLRAEYSSHFNTHRRLEQQFKEWELKISEALRQMDYYRHQMAELDEAGLNVGEEEELLNRRRQYQQIGRLRELAREAEELTYTSSSSIIDNCYRLQEISSELAHRDQNAPQAQENLTEIIDTLQEVYKKNSAYMNSLETDEQTIDETEERLAILERLKRKFATDIEGLIKLRDELHKKVGRLENRDAEKEEMTIALTAEKQKMLDSAAKLSARRRQQGVALAKTVCLHLVDLNLPQARFTITQEETKASTTGRDQISFCFSANPGEEPSPIDKNASGGELSRLLLALKTTLAQRYQVPTLIFDEVDSGLGGGTAAAVGRKLSDISRECQVITVTHLPQVAAFADQHLVIDKIESSETERTLIQLNEFSTTQEADRIRELARMGSGEEITTAAEEHAKVLRQEADKIRKGVN